MRYTGPGNGNDILLTRDGFSLQRVEVNHSPYSAAFKETGVSADNNTPVTDMMDYYIAEFLKRNGSLSIDIVAKEPAMLSDQLGFKIIMSMKNDKGLRYRIVSYGCFNASGIYEMVFWAPELHYAERDFPEFQKMVESFTIL